jgi:CubicO group peptidase (beta-lactamase class C family)
MKQKITLSILITFLSLYSSAQSIYFPPTTGTVWDSILPANVGYCQARIDSLYNFLQANNSKSFIILKDGKRVLEKYFGTYTRDSLWYWASASKSLAGFITGVAQQKGYININNKVSQYLGNGWTSAPLAKENLITVRHLLEMTSGLSDVPTIPCTNEDTAKSCLIYLADAGTRWSYHTGAYRKVQDVVSSAVGQNYNTITNNWIENKIGMSGIWYQQVYFSKARDMARFGLLTLNKGIWNTDTIMHDTTFYRAMVNTSQTLNKAYGYLWWLNGKASGMVPQSQLVFPGSLVPNAPSDAFSALGKNDQKIYVVPSQKLVVIRQGNSAGGFSLASSSFDNVLWDYINKLTCASTGVENITDDNHYAMYPNPIKNTLTINGLDENETTIHVYNMYGCLINSYYQKEKTATIDFSSLPESIYTIELVTKNKSVFREKVIKLN